MVIPDDDPVQELSGEEEDYMSMTIMEPTKPQERETYSQRRRRKERESEDKGRNKPRKQLEAEAAATRDAALATSTLSGESKGFKMMAKLGFKQGQTLGVKRDGASARLEPVELDVKEDRGGIGMNTEKKRKLREEIESEARRVKTEEWDFRERIAREREEKRLEGMIYGAMKVAERLELEEESLLGKAQDAETGDSKAGVIKEVNTLKPRNLKHVNVLWRSLLRERIEMERERRMRYDLTQTLSRDPMYNDPEEDKQDRIAFGNQEEILDEEDRELDRFLQLDPVERLRKLVSYLREKYNYCFWCKFRYPDASMEGCPGLTEEDHD